MVVGRLVKQLVGSLCGANSLGDTPIRTFKHPHTTIVCSPVPAMFANAILAVGVFWALLHAAERLLNLSSRPRQILPTIHNPRPIRSFTFGLHRLSLSLRTNTLNGYHARMSVACKHNLGLSLVLRSVYDFGVWVCGVGMVVMIGVLLVFCLQTLYTLARRWGIDPTLTSKVETNYKLSKRDFKGSSAIPTLQPIVSLSLATRHIQYQNDALDTRHHCPSERLANHGDNRICCSSIS